MDSLGEQIIAAATTALDDAAKPAGLTVERSRRRPTEDTELPIAMVRARAEQVEKAKSDARCPVVKRSLHVIVTVRCVGIDKDLDPYKKWVVSQIMTQWRTTGTTLANLAVEIEEVAHDWDPRGAEQAGEVSTYAEDDVTFVVTYETNRFDSTAKR
jgi:hypothetical protein